MVKKQTRRASVGSRRLPGASISPRNDRTNSVRLGSETARVLGDDAYAKMLDAIRSGTLPPGARVRETQVAEWLRMSRTPVREAIQRLEAEGLLTLAARAGLIVTPLERQLVSELYLMREILEGTAARLAAESAAASDLHQLQEMVRVESRGSGDPALAAENNRRFHALVYRSAKNRFLVKSLNALHDSMALLGKTTLSNKARARQAAMEHSKIIDAIVARKPDLAESLMRQHIQAAYAERLKLLRMT